MTADIDAGGLLSQGFELMIMGMGTVFVLLTVLVVSTILMSKILGQKQDVSPSSDEIAAIMAALKLHKTGT